MKTKKFLNELEEQYVNMLKHFAELSGEDERSVLDGIKLIKESPEYIVEDQFLVGMFSGYCLTQTSPEFANKLINMTEKEFIEAFKGLSNDLPSTAT